MSALRLPADSTYPSQLVTGGGRLLGWAFQETSGLNNANLVIRDGTAATGNLMVPISLTPGQSTRDWESIHPMPYYQGVFLQNVSGTWEGSIWIHPCDPDDDWHIGVVLTIPLTHQSISGT